MNKLEDWDFANVAKNSTTQLINRQKSALNVRIISIDKSSKTGVFSDLSNGKVQTSLEMCECHDFNFVGLSPRKKFQPCMHIYRLAIELGIMEEKYISQKTLMARKTPEERLKEEVDKLHSLHKDETQWGFWNEQVHNSHSQKNRQISAYGIKNDGQIIDKERHRGEINGYWTTLSSCTCPDFSERRLPCKHIYCLAILLGIQLGKTEEDFKNYQNQFKEDFHPLLSVRYKNDRVEIIDHLNPTKGEEKS